MSKIESALKRLAEGEFVCPVRFPDEHEALRSSEGRARAQDWLGAIGYRLAQLGDDGAFFMAHAFLTAEAKTRVREEMRSMRDKLQPVVAFLETLRLAQQRGAHLQPGDLIFESEVMEMVRQNAMLERRLNEMREVHGARPAESASDRLGRILVLLVAEGYLVEVNPDHNAYKITGKISYLYQLLAFMAEHVPQMEDTSVDDQIQEQQQLEDAAAGPLE